MRKQLFFQLVEDSILLSASYLAFSFYGIGPAALIYSTIRSRLSNKYDERVLKTTGQYSKTRYSSLFLLNGFVKMKKMTAKLNASSLDETIKAFLAWSLASEDWQIILRTKLCERCDKTWEQINSDVEHGYSKREVSEAFSTFYDKSDYMQSFKNSMLVNIFLFEDAPRPTYNFSESELKTLEISLSGKKINCEFMKKIIKDQPNSGLLELFSKLVNAELNILTSKFRGDERVIVQESYSEIANILKDFDNSVEEKKVLENIATPILKKTINRL